MEYEIIYNILILQYFIIGVIFIFDSFQKQNDLDLRDFKTRKDFVISFIPFYWVYALMKYFYKICISRIINNYKSLPWK